MSLENSRFDIIAHSINVPAGESLTIEPIGDIHANAPMFADDHFDAWCRKQAKATGTVWYIGMGDYLETFSASERKLLSQVHESSMGWFDDMIEQEVDKLAKKMSMTKGKWLGMLAGNHTYQNSEGKTVTQMLAERLDAPVLGICAAIRLFLQWGNRGTQWNYDIWAYHGKGGGVLAGSTLNSLEKWANGIEGDMILMGHDHKKAATKIERVHLNGHPENIRLKNKTIVLGRTGSFLKGYEPSKASYVSAKAMNPVSLGTIQFDISVESRMINGNDERFIVTEIRQ